MIKPEELRIGNYVAVDDLLRKELFDCDEIIFKENAHDIAMIDRLFLNINIEGMESEVTISDVEPIPLTEQWLKDFGFIAILNQFKCKQSIPPFILLKLENQYRYDDLRYRTNIKYVHQLQNLYFVLTGLELTKQ